MKAMIVVLLLAAQSLAMKSRERTFPQDCDSVWKAAVSVAKSERYRIVSIATEEKIISVAAGGFIGGERIISLSLAANSDPRGCRVIVQSRYSGLVHSDGPDLLRRIYVELVGDSMGRDSKTFQRFKSCMDGAGIGDEECEQRLQKDMKQQTNTSENHMSAWWQSTPH